MVIYITNKSAVSNPQKYKGIRNNHQMCWAGVALNNTSMVLKTGTTSNKNKIGTKNISI